MWIGYVYKFRLSKSFCRCILILEKFFQKTRHPPGLLERWHPATQPSATPSRPQPGEAPQFHFANGSASWCCWWQPSPLRWDTWLWAGTAAASSRATATEESARGGSRNGRGTAACYVRCSVPVQTTKAWRAGVEERWNLRCDREVPGWMV